MEEASKTAQPSRAQLGAIWLIAASLYFLLAASTIHLTSDGKTIAAVWPAGRAARTPPLDAIAE